jgi:hypothetical protein
MTSAVPHLDRVGEKANKKPLIQGMAALTDACLQNQLSILEACSLVSNVFRIVKGDEGISALPANMGVQRSCTSTKRSSE